MSAAKKLKIVPNLNTYSILLSHSLSGELKPVSSAIEDTAVETKRYLFIVYFLLI